MLWTHSKTWILVVVIALLVQIDGKKRGEGEGRDCLHSQDLLVTTKKLEIELTKLQNSLGKTHIKKVFF